MALFNRKKKEEPARDASQRDAGGEKKEPAKTEPAKKAAPVSMKDLYGAAPAAGESIKTKIQKSVASQAFRILIKPLVTEKASVLGTENKYAFAVAIDANKIEIAKAVKEIYGIKPTAVNVIRMDGKLTRTGRSKGQRKDWKKAIVTLPQGKAIQVYEGV